MEAKRNPTPTPPAGIPAIVGGHSGPAPASGGNVVPGIADTAMGKPSPMSRYDEAIKPTAPPESPISAPPPLPREAAPAQERSASASATSSPPGAIKCTTCDAPIPPGFAFCGACGAAVPGAAAPPRSVAPSQGPGSARLVLIQPDGTEGGHVEIPKSDVAVGRDAGGFFETDPFLSPTHAVFRSTGTHIVVKDAGSLNGVFIKVMPNQPMELKSGSIFRMGQELILFEQVDKGSMAADGTEKIGSPIEGLWGRVALIVGKGRLGNAFPLGGDAVVFGRERGNILFPEDGYVSGVHLKIHQERGKFFLTDLGSSNGTFIKTTTENKLVPGSLILMGQQLFRVEV
jgi:pSer/pThr/pTyr-binding forkhead associated (FHA) protein